jgi:hypothetical protein
MDILKQVKTKLVALDKPALDSICVKADVPVHTAIKIVNGATSNPRFQTVHKLAVALGVYPS